ncbi:hypothetical protein [Desulfosporosinus hippei]|uniref:Uncharacterized protein n=1 Tax=Desulfosporosinus hippei DSM 8344 TaxID=1121419 RepID=A0A1G8LTM4_9FIRM|nr:hypothetical protein [Desulfosporosinus hippei]SDI59072.1 hypothetical protein SAMN05443529_15421 [Desulfosporosinus hippei DSM 8344]
MCDEVSELDWLTTTIGILTDLSEKAGKKLFKLINRQLQQWIMALAAISESASWIGATRSE